MSHLEPGTRVAAGETFQSSHLSIKALLWTSLSAVLSPPLKAQEGIVGQREWREDKTGARIYFPRDDLHKFFWRRWITWSVERETGLWSMLAENNERGTNFNAPNHLILKFRSTVNSRRSQKESLVGMDEWYGEQTETDWDYVGKICFPSCP